ncbi:MAG: T9SS type A sorting domain-containing protein [Bacteroidales bacterium]|nr:T9SS type A sorting domain-containing protein [Bacteroidales bacterium]
MKKITIIALLAATSAFLFAQKPIVLEFEKHAIRNESNNVMKLCKYADPGARGANVTWDFSTLETTSDFTGYVQSSYHSSNTQLFPQANTELNEFNNRFYFRITEDRVEQYGYSSLNNQVVTTFDKPFVKMVYPFTMHDIYEGTFRGTYKYGNSTSDISGNYEILGDGYGKLILPGNFTVDNTLRVKTTKSYSYELSGVPQDVLITTYRWYCDWHRYPLLVLTSIKTSVNQNTSYVYQAAYNNKATKLAEKENPVISKDKMFDVFPNPASEFLNISFTLEEESMVTIELFDIKGRKTGTLSNEMMQPGSRKLQSDISREKYTDGTYYIKVSINGNSETQQVVLVK